MDSLLETISGKVGQKWPQLYSRLYLEPRNRFKIDSRHQHEPPDVKFKKCSRDTLDLWRQSETVKGLDEREAMRRLLSALRKVQGFETVAQELGQENGILLSPNQTPSPSPSNHYTKMSGHMTKTPDQVTPNRSPVSSLSPFQSRSDASTGFDESDLHTALLTPSTPIRVECHHHDDDDGRMVTHSVLNGDYGSQTGDLSDTSPPTLYNGTLHHETFTPTYHQLKPASTSIQLSNTQHKFAILDVSQRIHPEHWFQVARELGLEVTLVQRLSKERSVEERSYKMFKEWIRREGERATFERLQSVLVSCSQDSALRVMNRRLMS